MKYSSYELFLYKQGKRVIGCTNDFEAGKIFLYEYLVYILRSRLVRIEQGVIIGKALKRYLCWRFER